MKGLQPDLGFLEKAPGWVLTRVWVSREQEYGRVALDLSVLVVATLPSVSWYSSEHWSSFQSIWFDSSVVFGVAAVAEAGTWPSDSGY